jgi:hypothetical protein
MASSALVDFSWLPSAVWFVPVIGTLACVLAFVVGWRFLVMRSVSQGDPDGPKDALFLLGITRERRAAPRRRGNVVEVELSTGPEVPSLRGWVQDRSIGGLCLLLDQPVDTNARYRVRPRNAAAAVPWTEVKICSCREDAGRYEVGCQFHHTPNWSLLLMFG